MVLNRRRAPSVYREMTGAARDWPELERLFRAHYARLVHSLSAIAGSDAASEAVQEAFLQAARHWSKVARYDDPAAWVRRVALNRLLNVRRARGRFPTATRPSCDGDVVGHLPIDAAHHRVEVEAAIAQLTPHQRAFVALDYFEDLSVAEIAKVLGVADGTVKATLSQARRRLAPLLEGFDE